jgi:hypothetical protein
MVENRNVRQMQVGWEEPFPKGNYMSSMLHRAHFGHDLLHGLREVVEPKGVDLEGKHLVVSRIGGMGEKYMIRVFGWGKHRAAHRYWDGLSDDEKVYHAVPSHPPGTILML